MGQISFPPPVGVGPPPRPRPPRVPWWARLTFGQWVDLGGIVSGVVGVIYYTARLFL